MLIGKESKSNSLLFRALKKAVLTAKPEKVHVGDVRLVDHKSAKLELTRVENEIYREEAAVRFGTNHNKHFRNT